MERRSLSRREFIRLSAVAAAGGILAACQPAAPQVVKETVVVEKEVEVPVEVEKTVLVEEIVEKEVTAVPEPGEPVEFEFWAQDWGPWLAICAEVETAVEDLNPNWDFVVRPLPWGDLTTKLVTAAAAGTEGDGFASYTYLWRQVATSELLLPLSPLISRQELEEIVFPEVLDELQEVGQELYFIPILSGFDSGAVTINTEHFEAGTDFAAIASWEELVDLAVGATQRDDDGNMMRQGLVVGGYGFGQAAQFCLSQGASFYNLDQRRFDLTIPEFEFGVNEIWKLFNEYNCSDLDFELGTQDIFGSRLASMVNYGPYSLSGFEASQPDMVLDQIVTPPLGAIEPEDQRFWQNALFGISLSRRLARDTAKMAVGAAALDYFLKPESLLMFLDFYSGGVCSPGVYESPNLGNYKYGLRTKDFGDRLWRRMVIVGNIIQEPYDIMGAEMQRIIRNEVSVTEGLTSLSDQLNELEAEAVARKFGA